VRSQAEFNEESTKLNERICELEKECDRYKTVIHRLSNKVEAANAAGIFPQKYSIERHDRYAAGINSQKYSIWRLLCSKYTRALTYANGCRICRARWHRSPGTHWRVVWLCYTQPGTIYMYYILYIYIYIYIYIIYVYMCMCMCMFMYVSIGVWLRYTQPGTIYMHVHVCLYV
jgi:hypothetical protein